MVYNIPLYIYILLYIYNEILAAEKNEILPFFTWMDLEYIMLGKISQKEKDKYHMILLFCGIKKKRDIDSEVHRFKEQTGGERRIGGWVK